MMGKLAKFGSNQGFIINDSVLYSNRGPSWYYGSELRTGSPGALLRLPKTMFVLAPDGVVSDAWLAAAAEDLYELGVAVNTATGAAAASRPFVFFLPTDIIAEPEAILGHRVFVAVITEYRVRLHPAHPLANTAADYAMSLVNLGDGGDEYMNTDDGPNIGWTVYPSRASDDRAIRSILTPRFTDFHTAFYQVNAEQTPGSPNSSAIIPDTAINALFAGDPTLSRHAVSSTDDALSQILSDAFTFFA